VANLLDFDVGARFGLYYYMASMTGGIGFAGTLFSEDSMEQPGAISAITIGSKYLVFAFIINAPHS
jgi:hypothetical protein